MYWLDPLCDRDLVIGNKHDLQSMAHMVLVNNCRNWIDQFGHGIARGTLLLKIKGRRVISFAGYSLMPLHKVMICSTFKCCRLYS